jgi:hypothetical protein
MPQSTHTRAPALAASLLRPGMNLGQQGENF